MTLLRSILVVCLAQACFLSINAEDCRHVPLDGQPNFRDVGGYKTRDGRTVKRGLVYRSGELPRLTDEDIARLEGLGISMVVNFLTEVETKSRGRDRLPDGTREISQPIENDDGLAAAVEKARKTADFSTLPPSINPEIHRTLVHDARKQYATLLRELARTNDPLVYHCSHGVHRTGTATAILLWGLGVPWKTIREDYLLSNKYRAAEIRTRLRQLRESAAKKQGIPPDKVDMNNISAFYILKGEYIDATRDEILKEYGSIDVYLTKGLGLTRGEIGQLGDRLLQ